jgi:aspartate racemase
MKTLGIIGGIGPESTQEYYRLLIESYREKVRDGSYPALIINIIDLKKMVDLFEANDLTGVVRRLLDELRKLAAAGVDFALLSANTPHIVFDDLRRQSPIPLLSIVEATCDAAKVLKLSKLGLFGTRFTMQARFYPEVFGRAGIVLAVPEPDEQSFIHEKYMNELVKGIFRPETREQLLGIVDHLKQREGIQGLILGGTELPLILRDDAGRGIPFLDTTRIHVDAAIKRMLS